MCPVVFGHLFGRRSIGRAKPAQRKPLEALQILPNSRPHCDYRQTTSSTPLGGTPFALYLAAMSRPRPVLPDKTYLVTRRCTQRQFLLRPSPEINHFFLYCLAYATFKFQVKIHAFCALSNHVHIVLTDVLGNLPKFMEWLVGNTARGLNAHYGRRENFWAPERYSRVELVDPQDILAKMVYTLTNPVAAGLVSEGKQWPGLRSNTLREGPQKIIVRKPRFFFRPGGKLPEKIELVVEPPTVCANLDGALAGQRFHDAVLQREAEIRTELRRAGKRFLGPERVLGQSPKDCPTSPEPRGNIKPQVACRDKWRRIERLQAVGEFLIAYREAFKKFASGVRDVIFPAGTYWLRVHCGVACHDPAPG